MASTEPASGRAATALASWRDTPTRQAIVAFVERVSGRAGSAPVPVEERLAVFDNDGTLWCEKPMPIQLDFILRRLVEMAEADAALLTRQPWKAAYERDHGWLGAVMDRHYAGDDTDAAVLAGGILAAFEGVSVEEFGTRADAFLRSARHPTLGRGYLETAYAPMVDLLAHLEANGFSNYIVSAGGRDFMRPISAEIYGIPRQRVIGSTAALEYTSDEGGGTIRHTPAATTSTTGRRRRSGSGAAPAAGRCWPPATPTATSRCCTSPSTRTSRRCDCSSRTTTTSETAYTTGAEEALERAAAHGWTVISMKDDWNVVF